MNPLVVVGISLLICAILFIFLLLASLLAAFIFRYAPSLEGTMLSLTPSDLARTLRQMPVYPAWWHPPGVPPPKRTLVLIVVNPEKKAGYLCGFDPLHRPLFSSNRNEGLQFDFEDIFAIERLYFKLEDECFYPFIVPVDLAMFRASGRRRLKRRRTMHSYLSPPLGFPPGGQKFPARVEPVHAFLDRPRKAS
jgi:hypothetical protein